MYLNIIIAGYTKILREKSKQIAFLAVQFNALHFTCHQRAMFRREKLGHTKTKHENPYQKPRPARELLKRRCAFRAIAESTSWWADHSSRGGNLVWFHVDIQNKGKVIAACEPDGSIGDGEMRLFE